MCVCVFRPRMQPLKIPPRWRLPAAFSCKEESHARRGFGTPSKPAPGPQLWSRLPGGVGGLEGEGEALFTGDGLCLPLSLTAGRIAREPRGTGVCRASAGGGVAAGPLRPPRSLLPRLPLPPWPLGAPRGFRVPESQVGALGFKVITTIRQVGPATPSRAACPH